MAIPLSVSRRRNRLAVGCPPYVCPPYVANAFSAPLGDEGKPRPYNVNVFWFWAIEIPVHFGDPVVGLCRRYSPRKPGGR
ncbi:MAG: hypothetical protein LBQ66_15560, partial [Planctomycetaceae bacterium]|nr:hypothetical protein [Planctomycetaceae bacterium]